MSVADGDGTCQFCEGGLTGRQRTTCADCRRRNPRGAKRPSGYARLTVEGREDRVEDRRTARDAHWKAGRTTLGVDGEGHEGAYFLLAAATDDGRSWHTWSDSPRGLSTIECFEFLLSLPPELTKWGFAFGYDINMILKDVHWKTLQRLHNTTRARWGVYRVEWIPGKKFCVSKWPRQLGSKWQGEKRSGSVTIWDMYPWQATSFVRYLQDSKLAPDEMIERIAGMKERRRDFNPTDEKDEIIRYCLDECRLMARGADRLHAMLVAQDIRVATFHSPATVSKYLMKQNGVADSMAPHPPELAPIFDAAYFGGRAELIHAGPVEGPLWQYDIRSAYPTAMLTLPCWAHGRWERGGTTLDHWSLVRVRWGPLRSDPQPLWGPLPVRPRTGSLKWPTRGEGWFWAVEVAGVAHLSSVKVLDRWTWVQECDHQPFGYLRDVYAERLSLKAQGDRREYVNKIALNASYGATAEHQRGTRPPRWREPAWAGLITATTRGAVGAQLGPDMVMVATDAVISRRPLELPMGTRLGEWEDKRYERGVFVGPGVYFLWADGGWASFKSRGISAADIDPEAVLALWETSGRDGRYRYDRSRFVGLGTALHRVNGLPPPDPEVAQSVWRMFVDGEVIRRLTLEPRREWLSTDPWDGSSRAPAPGVVKRASLEDGMQATKLRMLIRAEKDPVRRLEMTDILVRMSSDEADESNVRSIFNDEDMP